MRNSLFCWNANKLVSRSSNKLSNKSFKFKNVSESLSLQCIVQMCLTSRCRWKKLIEDFQFLINFTSDCMCKISEEKNISMRSFTKFFMHAFKRVIPTRLKIGFMLFTGSFMTFMLRSNFSIIILSMAERFQWTNYEQNLLLSAYFCGYVGPNLIAGTMAERYGGRRIIFLVFLLSSFITAVSPFSANSSFKFLFFTRLALGVCGVWTLVFSIFPLLLNFNRDSSFPPATVLSAVGHHQPRKGCLYPACWVLS